LFPLTKERAKPSIPLAGKYRLIDVAVSNCINSRLENIYVLTQFNTTSLHRHITRTYRFSGFSELSVDILPTEQTFEHHDWFQSTTDAVRRAWRHFDSDRIQTCLILPGDHLYRMDYSELIQYHWDTDADVTLAVTPVTEEKAMTSGVAVVDGQQRVRMYYEEPRGPVLKEMQLSPHGPNGASDKPYLAAMDVYVFKKSVLEQLLKETTPTFDFGIELIPQAVRDYDVRAYPFDGYWEKIGSISSFYRVSLDLVQPDPPFSFYDPDAPMYTRPRSLPSAKIASCEIRACLLGEGVILNGARLNQCIVGIRTRIEPGADLARTIIMGASRYQTIDDVEDDWRHNRPVLGIGAGAVIRNAILDKNIRIGAGARIVNEAGLRHFDGHNYYIREGITIIPRQAVIPAGMVI
jgi:glucose-1-phosphate adenylyltransferase